MFRAGSLISIVSILLSIPLDAGAQSGTQANARYSNDHANWERLPVINDYQVRALLQASKRD